MKKQILTILTLLYCFYCTAQTTAAKEKMVKIPGEEIKSNGYCICQVINFSSENNIRRTDAIFVESQERLSKKGMLRKIDFELQQALVFFDSYKMMKKYRSSTDCYSLYQYLKKEQGEMINQYTILMPSYSSR